MIKKLTKVLVFLIIFFNFTTAYAEERVVLKSIPSDLWYERVYLIADKLSWVEYENFTVQVGELGAEELYNFPNWYHGKYDPELYKVDINNDTRKDIVVILNNDKAPIDKPRKDIHILNQVNKPNGRYEEAAIETIPEIIKDYIKISEKSKVVTIKTPQKTYSIDLEKFNYDNPHNPYIYKDSLEYHIEDGNLIGEMNVMVVVDDRATGGAIGRVRIKYGWEKWMYRVRDIEFVGLV